MYGAGDNRQSAKCKKNTYIRTVAAKMALTLRVHSFELKRDINLNFGYDLVTLVGY